MAKTEQKQGPQGKNGGPTGGGAEPCCGQGCKHKAERYGFCGEHYQQFKFGLVTKKGQPVPDYEKKLGHYQQWKLNEQKKFGKAA